MIPAVVIVLLVLVIATAKIIDLKRKRDADALRVQALLSDALLRERGLAALAVTPSAHTPLWRGSPVVISVSGIVPSKEDRQTILQFVNAEAARIQTDFRVEDLLVIGPLPAAS